MKTPSRTLVLLALAGALVSSVVFVARARSAPPTRCAPGMISLGPRCCGEGQRLVAGRCEGTPTRCAAGLTVHESGCVAPPRTVELPGGTLRIGPGDWEAQGAIEPFIAEVAPFHIDAYEVTEARYAACEAAGACPRIPLRGEPGRAVAGVSLADSKAFCAWAKGSLPTVAELAFATAGPLGRRYAWGDTGTVCRRAVWGLAQGPCAHGADGPEITGAHPDGATPTGIHNLSGNVAEWTLPSDPASPFAEVRGGSWADGAASALRSWHRRLVPASFRSPEIGFRCVYRA
ncbi:MAG: formylglycine-generating enzyme family protein [Polyangiaceae bacterium]|nr:formylglycine-generating enzyme family protein [Polyangiaceae bacterium]